MTGTSKSTLRRRRILAAALALPLAVAMTGTAAAVGSTADPRSPAADSPAADSSPADGHARKAPEKGSGADAAEQAPADKASSKPGPDNGGRQGAPGGAAAEPAARDSAAHGGGAAAREPDSSSSSDKHGTASSPPLNAPQPVSQADSNGSGANPGPTCRHDYCSTRDGSASGNGAGSGNAEGKPCAGCVGKADNKNPQGQHPNGSDDNAGYECDRNKGIGRTNPAHTGCRTSSAAPTATAKPSPSSAKPSPTPSPTLSPSTGRTGAPGTSEMTITADCRTVSVTSSKDISFVEITFADGTVLKLEGLSGRTFTRSFTKDIASARAKSATTVVSTLAAGCGGGAVPSPTGGGGGGGTVPPPTGGGGGSVPPPIPPPTGGGGGGGVPPTGVGGGAGTVPPGNPPAVGPVPVGPPGTVPPGIVPNNRLTPAKTTLGRGGKPPSRRVATAAPRTLPFTGTDIALLVELGVLLLTAGGGVLLTARRERAARAA